MAISFSKKQWIFIVIGIAIVLIGKLFAPINALSAAGNTALFFMLSIVFFLLTEALPAGLIAIIGVVFLPILGLTKTLAEASSLFGNQLFFYTVACFAMAGVMEKSPLTKRFLYTLLKAFNKSTKGTITAIILTSVILSSFISNFPTAILMMIVGKQYLSMLDDEAERKQTSKSLMIGIVLGVAIGGICTPVGNSCMILASTFLTNAGYPISFVQWMAFGIPVAVIMFFATRFFLFKFLPPVEQTEEMRQDFINKVAAQIPEKFGIQEIITAIIFLATFICWILNFNLIIVTCLCAILLLYPGFGLISWKDFQMSTGWSTVILICSLVSVVTVLQKTGVLDWLLGFLKAAIPAGASPFVVILIFGIFTALIVILMPNGPVLTTVLSTTIIGLAAAIGVHPAVLLLGFANFTTFGFILPTETLCLAIYDSGKNFDAKDLPKVGLPVSLVATIATAVWLPICAKLLGIM